MPPGTKFPYNPSTSIPNLSGKVILITGANTGLGKATALELSRHGPAEIWMASRDVTKGQKTVSEVQATASPGTKIQFLQLDLSSFASIKSAAGAFLADAERLDVLYLNAGIFGAPAALTEDGYEVHIGINHLGHALLLKLLTPLLLSSAALPPGSDVRVVSLTSIGYKYSPD